SQQPAIIQATQSHPSSENLATASASNFPTTSRDALAKQQIELDKKAAELDRREQNLNNIRRYIFIFLGITNNFPPLPSFCPVKPCFVQDFNVDIPQPFQLIVRIHFYIWISFSLLMLLNVCGAISYFIVEHSTVSGSTFGISIFYFVLCIPLSYIFWFRPVYNAFKNDSSIYFFIYFIIFFLHNCILVVWCVGIPASGGVGFISGIATTNRSLGVGIFMVIIGVLFGVLGAIGFLLIVKVLHCYRHMDASFQKAQAELASGVLSNRGVQEAATAVASSAFSGQSSYNRY
ncbi:hypothetical protein HELRODRAFT_83069, partial [Helobdella robusta]|uniref:Secretory carrier-associated membrane protein n=1 Tax=Helobdella robusta TaxID=6412 RepID=T1G500_HELRO